MNRILIILLLSTNLFSQNNSKLKFEDIKKSIEFNNINLQNVDLSNEKLNDTELQIIQILNGNTDDFNDKKISFISGPAGTTVSEKTIFFKSFIDYYSKEHIIQYNIIKLEEKERKLSGVDYLIFFWTKMVNPKSKKLLKKIRKK